MYHSHELYTRYLIGLLHEWRNKLYDANYNSSVREAMENVLFQAWLEVNEINQSQYGDDGSPCLNDLVTFIEQYFHLCKTTLKQPAKIVDFPDLVVGKCDCVVVQPLPEIVYEAQSPALKDSNESECMDEITQVLDAQKTYSQMKIDEMQENVSKAIVSNELNAKNNDFMNLLVDFPLCFVEQRLCKYKISWIQRHIMIFGDDEFAYSLIDATSVFMMNHNFSPTKNWIEREIYGLKCVHEI